MYNLIWLILFSLFISFESSASDEHCSPSLSVHLKNSVVNGEPLSDLYVSNKHGERHIELPFLAENVKCKNLSDNVLRVSLGADLPRGMFADYFFVNGKKFSYIGGVVAQTSASGSYRATGIYQIDQGDGIGRVNIENIENDEDKVLLIAIGSIPYTSNKYSTRELYDKGRSIEIDLLAKSSNQKICRKDETAFYYCKTKKGKIMNLCYEPTIGHISYYFGNENAIDIKLSDYEYLAGEYLFINNDYIYTISPDKNKIKVESKGMVKAELDCFN